MSSVSSLHPRAAPTPSLASSPLPLHPPLSPIYLSLLRSIGGGGRRGGNETKEERKRIKRRRREEKASLDEEGEGRRRRRRSKKDNLDGQQLRRRRRREGECGVKEERRSVVRDERGV